MPFRLGSREEGWELPPSLDLLVPADHPVRFVAAYLDSLDATDWRHLGISVQPGERGAARYHPKAVLGLWLWGFMQGVRSSRKLEAAAVEAEWRLLAATFNLRVLARIWQQRPALLPLRASVA
jgi:transposase